MGIPNAPGTPGPKAVGGGKGRPPGAGPPNMFGPGIFVSKATGNAGCPGSKGGEGPPPTGLYAVLSVAISDLDRRPTGALDCWNRCEMSGYSNKINTV